MNARFIFITDDFDLEIEVNADDVGDMHKLDRDVALEKAKTLAKAKALELLMKVCEQIDKQTFEDVFDFDDGPEYCY